MGEEGFASRRKWYEQWQGEKKNGPEIGLWQMPQKMSISIPRTFEYVTLCCKRDFADVVKDLEMRLFWTIPHQYNHQSSKVEEGGR